MARRPDSRHSIVWRTKAAILVRDTLYGERTSARPRPRYAISGVQRERWAMALGNFLGKRTLTYDEIYALAARYVTEHGLATGIGDAADEILKNRFWNYMHAEAERLGRKPWDLAAAPGYLGDGRGIGATRTLIQQAVKLADAAHERAESEA